MNSGVMVVYNSMTWTIYLFLKKDAKAVSATTTATATKPSPAATTTSATPNVAVTTAAVKVTPTTASVTTPAAAKATTTPSVPPAKVLYLKMNERSQLNFHIFQHFVVS